MISERKFAEAFTSFWQQALPTADAFVRRANLRLQRFAEPMGSNVSASRRALVNELAFRLFSIEGRHAHVITRVPVRFQLVRSESASSRLVSLGIEPAVVKKLFRWECSEILEQANRLQKFFRFRDGLGKLMINPSFPGCGIIDNCEGDVLAGDTLYEVKAGERHFRLVDFRQVLVYCALNHEANIYSISNIALVNPRVGVFLKRSIEDVARESGVNSAVELFSEIVEFISSYENSQ